MNPFLLSPQERLADWKEFRKHLADLPETEKFSSVARYWANAPLINHAYDLEGEIPTPWTMVHDGYWCRISVAIGMEFTLRLAGISPDRMKLQLIRDVDLSEMILLLIIDQHVVLNYQHGTVTSLPTSNHIVVETWQHDGKKYVRS